MGLAGPTGFLLARRIAMRKAMLAVILAGLGTSTVAAADYKIDSSHAAVVFKISHLGLSWTYGRFTDIAGEFTADPAEPGKASFRLALKTESLDTDNKQRDTHLRSPDFLNTKQF